MYSKAIEAELTLQRLIEENEELKEKIRLIEEEKGNDSKEEYKVKGNDKDDGVISQLKGINKNNEIDFDIFKKIQDQMNKRAKILDDTLSKYSPYTSNPPSHSNANTDTKANDIASDINIDPINDNPQTPNDPPNNLYPSLIYKIPSILLDNKIEEIGLYVRLELSYQKLLQIPSKQPRISFITLLKQVLNNIVMLKQTCFTVFLQLFTFLINLLKEELSKPIESQDNDIISSLQSLGQFILINKDISEALRIIIVMIKRFFPTTFKIPIDQCTMLYLKILLFYLKKLTMLIQSSYIHISEIFSEVNDFLYAYPPSLLTKDIPNVDLYLDIYKEIRKISDELMEGNGKERLIDALAYVKNKNMTPSKEYIQYLEYKLLKKII